VLYAGGTGDGFDRFSFAGVLSGEMLMLYGGGTGDGFDRDRGSFVLNGQNLADLYGGGTGDGFDTEIFYGVIPLPLTLVHFDAFPMKDYVLLKWQTEDEVATDFFTIEKTTDGLDFSAVGEVEAAGYSEPGERLHYEMEDHEPHTGTSYYRLRTDDFDGAISYSHLVEVTYATAEEWDFTIFPNPNTGRQLGFRAHGLEHGSELHFEILDVQGRHLLRESFATDGSDRRFDLRKQLATGSYLIRATDAAGKTRAKVLIVQ
ncbi:MAG: T9SS type A sorting domain-containing protein, partial [Bacteroidota bacterium]